MKNFTTNTKVEWDWGKGSATGYIAEKYTSKVTKQINKNEVTREASADEPAYLIKQDDGQRVLKSCTEIRKAD